MSAVTPTRKEAFTEARTAVARLLAYERGEQPKAGHHNEAMKILWPHLSDETRSALVMR